MGAKVEARLEPMNRADEVPRDPGIPRHRLIARPELLERLSIPVAQPRIFRPHFSGSEKSGIFLLQRAKIAVAVEPRVWLERIWHNMLRLVEISQQRARAVGQPIVSRIRPIDQRYQPGQRCRIKALGGRRQRLIGVESQRA